MGRICAINNCSNSTYSLERWKARNCCQHNCKYGDEACDCPAPFILYPFPTEKNDAFLRKQWIKLVNRKDAKTGKNWEPDRNSRICSKHFVNGQPNTLPTLSLGYQVNQPKPCRASPKKRGPLPEKSVKKAKQSLDLKDVTADKAIISSDHKIHVNHDHGKYHFSCACQSDCQCNGCLSFSQQLMDRENKIDSLTSQLSQLELKHESYVKNKKFNVHVFLRTDKKTKHYTGLPNRAAFHALVSHVHESAKGMRYWCGSKKITSTKVKRIFKRTPRKSGPCRKLDPSSELLLVLMKLRLGLTNEFLADLFEISPTTCSQIFNTWIKMLATELQPLIFWPDKGMIKKQMPQSLHTQFPDLRCTIDCTEFFIGRPRHLHLQALTWSDYKKHNTIKLLVGIAPNGMITFLSKAWGGRASDNHITKTSGFLNLVEPGDLIMADRGFTIREELVLRNATLHIPPPSAGIEQQTREAVQKTKKIANARIHVERAIGRLKWFSLLKNVLPVNLVPLIDDIIIVCAALCNLLPPLVH